jgi:hypothetical protein
MRIWNLGFASNAALRGPSPTCDVLKNVERHLSSLLGNQTEKYPVEVFFDLLGQSVGEELRPFRTGISIGFGTTLACHLIGHAMLQLGSWCPWSQQVVIKTMGRVFLKVFRLTATADSAPDVLTKIVRSAGGKQAASERQAPNPLQWYISLLRLANEINPEAAQRGDRRLWQDVCSRYNAAERVKSAKLTPEMVNCVLLLARSSPEFRDKLQAGA